MKRSAWVAVATISLLCGLWVPGAMAQAVYGSILGTVTDPTGAAVNGAKVTVTSQTKNVSTDTTTNESGNYSVTHLIPDVYSIRVEGTGFKALQFKDIQVSADSGARVDGQFQVGGTSETVEVTANSKPIAPTWRWNSTRDRLRICRYSTGTSRPCNSWRLVPRKWGGATRPQKIHRAASRS